jgi:hypothetical protein
MWVGMLEDFVAPLSDHRFRYNNQCACLIINQSHDYSILIPLTNRQILMDQAQSHQCLAKPHLVSQNTATSWLGLRKIFLQFPREHVEVEFRAFE